MFTQSPSRVQEAETYGCNARVVAQRTASTPTIAGRCRHCGSYEQDLVGHLDAERAKERRLFLLHDQNNYSGVQLPRGSKGGANRMMKLIGALAIPVSGLIGIAIARGRDQMERIEDLFQSYRTTL